MRRAQPSESRELAAWIAERHYIPGPPPAYRFALEFIAGKRRVCALLLEVQQGAATHPQPGEGAEVHLCRLQGPRPLAERSRSEADQVEAHGRDVPVDRGVEAGA